MPSCRALVPTKVRVRPKHCTQTMATLAICRRTLLSQKICSRALTTGVTSTTTPTPTPTSTTTSEGVPLTHYKVTLRRSGISLVEAIKGTLTALGLHKRNQTVYHRHSPDIAGKILKVKELVEVENVPAHTVRNQWEQRQERKAARGYKVVSNKRDSFMHV